MEGRYPTGIMFVLCNSDPALEDDFNNWYNYTHLTEVTAPGMFGNATRYVNPSAKATVPDPKYLAIYETERADPASAWNENMPIVQEARRKIGGKPHPGLAVALSGVYARTAYHYSEPSPKRTKGILVTLMDEDGPSAQADLGKLHSKMDAAVLASSSYWSVTRFVHTAPEPGKPKHLAVYETEEEGPVAFKRLSDALRRGPEGNILESKGMKYVGPFNLLFSQMLESRR